MPAHLKLCRRFFPCCVGSFQKIIFSGGTRQRQPKTPQQSDPRDFVTFEACDQCIALHLCSRSNINSLNIISLQNRYCCWGFQNFRDKEQSTRQYWGDRLKCSLTCPALSSATCTLWHEKTLWNIACSHSTQTFVIFFSQGKLGPQFCWYWRLLKIYRKIPEAITNQSSFRGKDWF